MKRFTSFISKIKKKLDREFFKYTFLFFVLLFGLYVYSLYAGMISSPKFTYAEF